MDMNLFHRIDVSMTKKTLMPAIFGYLMDFVVSLDDSEYPG